MMSELPGNELMLSWHQDAGLPPDPSLNLGLTATASGALIPACS